MRLLSTNELETKRRQQEAQTVMRGAKVASLVDGQIKKLNASRDELEAFKKAHEENQQKFLDENLQERLKAERILKDLQDQCAIALKPIRLEREELEETKKTVEEKLLAAQHLEQEAARKLNIARQKEATNKGTEKELKLSLQQIENGLQSLERREKIIKLNETELEERKHDFELDILRKYENVDKKKKEAEDAIAVYTAKSGLLDEDRELLAKEKIQLESRENALKTAFEIARKKGIM